MLPRVLQETVERGGSEPRCPLRWEGLLGHNHSPSARYVSAHLAGVLAVNCTGAERGRATLGQVTAQVHHSGAPRGGTAGILPGRPRPRPAGTRAATPSGWLALAERAVPDARPAPSVTAEADGRSPHTAEAPCWGRGWSRVGRLGTAGDRQVVGSPVGLRTIWKAKGSLFGMGSSAGVAGL